jgi:serine/threonine-protein kinase
LALVGMIALFLAVAALAVNALSGDDKKTSGAGKAQAPAKKKADKPKAKAQPPAAQAPAEQTTGAAPSGEAEGTRLNNEGFAKLQAGDPGGAIPILQRAVAAFPEGTSNVNYAYALYNLADALIQAGRPAEAIPLLEQRLRIPNQQGKVKKRLKDARKAAGGGGGNNQQEGD